MLYDISLEVGLLSKSGGKKIITQTNYKEMYYSLPSNWRITQRQDAQ